MQEILAKAEKIKLLILDVDGVLTDGTILLTDKGQEYKLFNSKDGIGLKMLIKSGVEVAVISGRQSPAVEHRLRPFGVKHIYQNHETKVIIYNKLKDELGLGDEEIAYVGDDLPDLGPIIKAGLGIAVADADEFTQKYVDHVTAKPGGHGAVREVCELILRAQNQLDPIQLQYLEDE